MPRRRAPLPLFLPFALPGLEQQWNWEETKLPVICTINHLLYRLPPHLSAPPPTDPKPPPPGHPPCGPGLSGALSISLDLGLPSPSILLFYFLNQRSSLATLHAFSVIEELGFSLAPRARADALALLGSAAGGRGGTLGPRTTEHSASDPCGGSRGPASVVPLPLSSLSSSHLRKRGFQTQFSFQKVYICGEGRGSVCESA